MINETAASRPVTTPATAVTIGAEPPVTRATTTDTAPSPAAVVTETRGSRLTFTRVASAPVADSPPADVSSGVSTEGGVVSASPEPVGFSVTSPPVLDSALLSLSHGQCAHNR
ncbi:hypothetical protein GCM10010116_09740 [Microbispora rosea subsp. aerata]|nr:hypothetical protein GCM10010116_09740 [Microbispora rosea subsp. aerata]GIH56248.1 hypothetical protein Mro02_31620 [Microbispora rosea subsp. aerata]GLJ82312.1 hypothetical protein GCM10017588_10370 [Microbispora rosea subsp. aerata]